MAEPAPATAVADTTASTIAASTPYDTIPVSNSLIKLVRKLNCFEESELGALKGHMCNLTSSLPQSNSADVRLDGATEPELETYFKYLLKAHQVLALLNVDFSKAKELSAEHLSDLKAQLLANNGLEYCPREQTPQGRQFEHASDTTSLIKHLKSLPKGPEPKKEALDTIKVDFEIKLMDGDSSSDEAFFSLKRSHFDLSLRANGKAELYFHCYFWTAYLEAVARACGQDSAALLQDLPQVARMQTLSTRPQLVLDKVASLPFGQEQYKQFVEDFGGRRQIKKIQLIEQLQRYLFVAQIYDNTESLRLIEKILVQLLGYQDIFVRDQAVVLLNMLYDGVDWQMQSAFRPIIRCVGQHFKVEMTIRYNGFTAESDTIFVGVSAPSNLASTHDEVLTWHKIAPRNIIKTTNYEVSLSINFGKFWKCGFYDWRVIVINSEGKLTTPLLTSPPSTHSFPISRSRLVSADEHDLVDDMEDDNPFAQGRFIVQAKGLRDQCFHEVQVDYENARIDFQNQTFQRRGTFEDVERSLSAYKESGVTALYLMGVFQRDNVEITGSAYQGYNDQRVQYKKADASPLAVTDRVTPCKMLGGEHAFKRVVSRARQEGVKVIVDCLARISSSRHHRKFKDLLLHYLDEEGRRRICYGTDGQARQYEDTAMLNYRKAEAWDLLVEEVLEFAEKTGVSGIHLDNGQAWPQILEPDIEELNRIDVDGQPAYTAEDLMNGEIVIRNENHGYWNTNSMELQANPFFVKLCRAVWRQNPDFMILGECWGGFMFEHRQIILARSGVVPRLFKLPQTICQMFGKRLHNDGRITECEQEPVTALKQWYEDSHFCMPEGSILLQSSTSHQWPYPAYLFGKGTWAAVDILHFLPDVPITFMGEVQGEVYRLGSTMSMYQAEKLSVKSGSNMKKSGSQLMLKLSAAAEEEAAISTTTTSKEASSMGLGVKVNSSSNLAAMAVKQSKAEGQNIEQQFKEGIGAQQGYDLSKISTHYNHRRMLRREKMVFRYGELAALRCMNDEQSKEQPFVSNVLSFARYTLMETAVVATNMSETTQKFWVDLTKLKNILGQIYGASAVVITCDLLTQKSEESQEYYFLQEFLTIKHWQTLAPYSSSVRLITVCNEDKYVFERALKSSIIRTKEKLTNGLNIEAEQISQLLTDCLTNRATDFAYFVNLVGGLQENFLDKIHMGLNDLFLNNHALKTNPILSSRLLALCSRIIETDESLVADNQARTLIRSVVSACKAVFETNQMGPIVFCTPELGRWSTVGGLGVMVDELSLGLAELGQEVIVISPYYDRNRKGVTGYLSKDPAGFEYIDNITVTADVKITLGVHEGTVGGVKLAFLHHAEIFPQPYPDQTAANAVRQLAVYGKACLEYLCKRQVIPSVCVTNDWFTGFIPGYAKTGQFGPTFKGTTFMHICHNLQESYEGRIFPEPRDGGLEYIHGLPRDILINPEWSSVCINPSRCAIMMSDNWSTVSNSYKEDLLNSSPLSPLLCLKESPFAHPNGIPIAERIRKLDERAPDHMAAKKALQMKYFNYGDLDDSVPLFAFVGRITQQKGVHLILDVAEHIIPHYNYKVQFLVGGPGNMNDPYSAQCAHRMWSLKQRYPNCFWAAPEEFFTDGALVNRGTDFGLMPSLFEPGGIVQHEFFVGATPVIAFKTGGLKDSVIEFMWDSEVGCGYTFESYEKKDFIFAIERAIGTFKNKQKYFRLRENAFNATMPGEKVCIAWLQEFCRLRNKVYFDCREMNATKALFKEWNARDYKPINIVDQVIGSDKRSQYELDDMDIGAEASRQPYDGRIVPSEFDRIMNERAPHTFRLHNWGPRHQVVQICGSFDNWEKRHEMQFDHYANQWFTTLHLPRGEYAYKYVINNQSWVVNQEEESAKDAAGNVNNHVSI